MSETFVVAAVHRWNERIFRDRIQRLPGKWVLISDPAELTESDLAALAPRYVFFLHWSWKIPAAIVNRFECIGFHMTDLPFGRGGSPLQNLISRGFRETMLSAFRLTEEIDAGPVYLKRALSLDGCAEEIYVRASALAAAMIEEIVATHPSPLPQEGTPVEFSRRSPAQSRLPSGMNAAGIYDFVRMLDAEGYPRAFIDDGNYRLEFSRATLGAGVVDAHVRITLSTDKEQE